MRRALLGLAVAAVAPLFATSLAFAANGAREAPAATAPGSCAILVVGENWTDSGTTPPRFFWGSGEPVFSTDCFYYSSAVPIRVDVTDAFFGGDRFRIYIDGSPLGDTVGSPPADNSLTVTDPNLAFGDNRYSWGFVPGPAGDHTVTIEVIVNPFDGGGAYIRALVPPPTQAIPTLGAVGLATLVLLLAAASAIALRRRRTA